MFRTPGPALIRCIRTVGFGSTCAGDYYASAAAATRLLPSAVAAKLCIVLSFFGHGGVKTHAGTVRYAGPTNAIHTVSTRLAGVVALPIWCCWPTGRLPKHASATPTAPCHAPPPPSTATDSTPPSAVDESMIWRLLGLHAGKRGHARVRSCATSCAGLCPVKIARQTHRSSAITIPLNRKLPSRFAKGSQCGLRVRFTPRGGPRRTLI